MPYLKYLKIKIMCLTCAFKKQTKEEKEKLFKWSKTKTYLHTYDNKSIHLNEIQIQELIDEALYILCTGVDLSCDIWAIQWNTEYKPINF